MVTVTLGKRWQDKVEEVAELKVKIQEMREKTEEYEVTIRNLTDMLTEAEDGWHDTDSRYHEMNTELKITQEQLEKITQEKEKLNSELQHANSRIQELSTTVQAFQHQVDIQGQEIYQLNDLIQKLKTEITQGEHIRDRLEREKEDWKLNYENKCHDVEVLQKAKDHCDRHIAILVKEKDRIIGKKFEPSPVLSKKHAAYEYQPSIQQSVPAKENSSWNEVEVLRLRQLLQEEQEGLKKKDEEIQKLKKENWNLVNRLRNRRQQYIQNVIQRFQQTSRQSSLHQKAAEAKQLQPFDTCFSLSNNKEQFNS